VRLVGARVEARLAAAAAAGRDRLGGGEEEGAEDLELLLAARDAARQGVLLA
jgi:hypothetical protein